MYVCEAEQGAVFTSAFATLPSCLNLGMCITRLSASVVEGRPITAEVAHPSRRGGWSPERRAGGSWRVTVPRIGDVAGGLTEKTIVARPAQWEEAARS